MQNQYGCLCLADNGFIFIPKSFRLRINQGKQREGKKADQIGRRAHAPKLLGRFWWNLHHYIVKNENMCRSFAFYSDWFSLSGLNWNKTIRPDFADEPMLRNYWSDFNEIFTIRRALVWNGAVLDFIFIGPPKMDQIRPKPPKTVADKPMLPNY